MIILITYMENNKLFVSHGVDEDTLKNIILPQESPEELGAVFNWEMREWVLM